MCFRNWNKKTPEEQARKTYERAQKLEAEFLEYFTGSSLTSAFMFTLDHASDVRYRILAPAPAGLACGYFWPYFSTGAVGIHVDYLQLKVMKLMLPCHYLSDLIDWRILVHSRLN